MLESLPPKALACRRLPPRRRGHPSQRRCDRAGQLALEREREPLALERVASHSLSCQHGRARFHQKVTFDLRSAHSCFSSCAAQFWTRISADGRSPTGVTARKRSPCGAGTIAASAGPSNTRRGGPICRLGDVATSQAKIDRPFDREKYSSRPSSRHQIGPVRSVRAHPAQLAVLRKTVHVDLAPARRVARVRDESTVGGDLRSPLVGGGREVRLRFAPALRQDDDVVQASGEQLIQQHGAVGGDRAGRHESRGSRKQRAFRAASGIEGDERALPGVEDARDDGGVVRRPGHADRKPLPSGQARAGSRRKVGNEEGQSLIAEVDGRQAVATVGDGDEEQTSRMAEHAS